MADNQESVLAENNESGKKDLPFSRENRVGTWGQVCSVLLLLQKCSNLLQDSKNLCFP